MSHDLKARLREKAFGVASLNLLDDKPSLIREALARIEKLEARIEKALDELDQAGTYYSRFDDANGGEWLSKAEGTLEGDGDE